MATIEEFRGVKLGTKLFLVEERNSSFQRTKIHKHIDGVDWFRYSAPNPTVTIIEVECVSIVTTISVSKYESRNATVIELEGDNISSAFYSLETTKMVECVDSEWDNVFLTLGEAKLQENELRGRLDMAEFQ